MCGDEGHKAINREKRINKNDRKYIIIKKDHNRKKCNYEFLNFNKLLEVYEKKFRKKENENKFCEIDTPIGKIANKKGAIIPQALQKKAKEYLINLEKRNIIRKSTSKWRNPVRFIEKDNGEIRMVLNMIELNKLVRKETSNLRTIRDVIRATHGAKWFTVIDLKEAFCCVEIDERDKHKTCFEVMGQIFEFNSMVMGFTNSPMILQRILTQVFLDLIGNGVECYLDDIVIYSQDRDKHQKLVLEVLERLVKNNPRINMKKIQYAENEVDLLGFKINANDIIPLEKQKTKILEFPKPTKIKECRQFLGIVNWFRSFIKDLALKTYALTCSL